MKKNVETVFSKDGIVDSKHIKNTSPEFVDSEILDEIDQKGVTLERLKHFESMGLDVYKYMTQITIHGLFNKSDFSRISGYKFIFQNKNMSIGVKWGAIDSDKRDKLYHYISMSSYKFSRLKNSTIDCMMKTESAKDVEDYKVKLENLKSIANKIDSSLYYGRTYITKYQMYGFVILSLIIEVNAFPEENMEKLVWQITDKTKKELDDQIEEERIKIQEENAKREKLEQQRKQQIQEIKDKFVSDNHQNLIDEGYQIVEQYKVKTGDICAILVFNHSTDLPRYSFKKCTKVAFGRSIFDFCNIKGEPVESHNKPKYIETFDGYVKKCDKKETPKYNKNTIIDLDDLFVKDLSELSPEKKQLKLNIRIEKYSEKCYVLIGETKPLKDDLKSMGLKWTTNLKCGPCWIFTPDKLNKISEYISKYQNQ